MQPEFWLERWKQNEIGFHQQDFNAHLQDHWPRLGVAVGARVFVPLCGKSRDLLWLRAHGHEVLGVEISDIAVRDFFAENALTPDVTAEPPFRRWQTDNLAILCGDFFALTPDMLRGVTAVYDRASLVALPPALRERYVSHMAALLPAGTETLLVAMDYPQAQMDGPPFAVTEDEVRRLYTPNFDIEALATRDILAENPRFRERGLTSLVERVCRLRRRA